MQDKIKQIIEFTKELVVIPSQNGIDSEKAMAKAVFNKLISFGLKPEIIGPKDHSSVICQVKKANSGKIIWLESCLDTVVAGETGKWTYPPFEGRIVGNKMFGRGVADAKVGIAIFCYLAKDLAADENFKGAIFLGFDADEQGGNFSGIREVIKHAPRADICILGYQGMEEISIGARGWLRLKLTTLGKAAHTGSRSKKGINAIHLMNKVITIILTMDLENKAEPFFEFGSSLNISQINGGISINIVPDKCEAKIDIRLLPSQNKEMILNKFQKALSGLNYKLEILQDESAFLTDPKNRGMQLLAKKAKEVLGKEILLTASGQGSVGNVISKMNIPIINAFRCESGNVHAADEWINIESIPKVLEIYKKLLLEF